MSRYIAAMPFLWLDIDDDPGPNSQRGFIERNSIALLSNLDRAPVDAPSPRWLGHYSDRPLVLGSGLWNRRHVEATKMMVFSKLSKKWSNGQERGNATMDNQHKCDLVARYRLLFSSNWSATGLDHAIDKLDPVQVVEQYCGLMKDAPRRSRSGLPYFVGHDGVPGGEGDSNRIEEHTAIALRNLESDWILPDGGGCFRLLDYQVPLKARGADSAVGKIDLLGVNQDGRLMIFELKVSPKLSGRGDAPPTALMEGLRYAAMVEADAKAIEEEVLQRFGMRLSWRAPIVVLLAPLKWWRSWVAVPAAGNWTPSFARLTSTLEAKLGIGITCLALEDVTVSMGGNGHPPGLEKRPELYPAPLSKASVSNEPIEA